MGSDQPGVWWPYGLAGAIAMSEHDEENPETSLLEELSELRNAIRPLLRRLPNARKAIDRLTGGLAGTGTRALASRWDLYRTGNLVKEAQQVADASGLPLPAVFNNLIRQRRIDELTMDALQSHGPVQMPFAHQGAMWELIPKADIEKATPVMVVGAMLTSCGVELLRIVDIEPLPEFTSKLKAHFSQSGCQMVRSG